MSMNYIGKFLANFKDFYNDINTATLTGAIDVIVVEQPDGSYNCSPFHVRFGKLGVLRSREKVVDIEINGQAQDIHMKLGESGEAFFVEELEDENFEEIPEHLATSPIPVSEFENIFTQGRRRSFDLGQEPPSLSLANEVNEYTKRRNTADSDSAKNRERDFLKRQIGLGNIGILGENTNSTEDMTSQNLTFDTINSNTNSAKNDSLDDLTENGAIFKMDSLTLDAPSESVQRASSLAIEAQSDAGSSTAKIEPPFRQLKTSETQIDGSSVKNNKNQQKKRRKTKKKNAPRKSSSVSQISANTSGLVAPSSSDLAEKLETVSTSTSDPSLTESNSSVECDLKEMQTSDQQQSSSSATNTSRKIIDPDFHFFSDTELTTNTLDSRADSPIQVETVQSDSELEMKNRKGECQESDGQSWEWGGFPNVVGSSQMNSPITSEAGGGSGSIVTPSQQSMISNMFSFMKKSHGQRHSPAGSNNNNENNNTQSDSRSQQINNEHNNATSGNVVATNEGIYLADLPSMDPADRELYFSQNILNSGGSNRKITEEDDKGDGADMMDCESGNGPSLAQSTTSPNSAEDGCKSIDSDFEEHTKNSRNFSQEIAMSLCGWDPEPDLQRFQEHSITFSDFCNDLMLLENPQLVVRVRGKFYNWKVAAPIISSLMIFNRPLLQSTIDQLCNLHMPSCSNENIIAGKENISSKQEVRSSWWSWRRSKSSRETTPVVDLPKGAVGGPSDPKDAVAGTSSVDESSSEPILVNQKSLNKDDVTDQIKVSEASQTSNVMITSSGSPEKFRKTLRLSSKQIASLNLRSGMNQINFSVTTAYQGTTRCTCYLYKWKWDDKIVISDIDGTITKSDVLGHILPIVGKDWAQSGVAQLFNKISENGYKLLYLSARAIGQARITRDYLRSIKQGDLTMPDGPILLNPTSLITAFHREVIEKKPEQFKIQCMSDIKALFPLDINPHPFYAGYGNKINDVWAYTAVGIPIVRIFTINSKGELKHELTQTFQSSYSNMSIIVDHMFPPLLEAANEYSQFTYWRDPLQAVDQLPEL